MKKVIILAAVFLASCAAPKKCCSQVKDFFKFSTVYGAVNGGNSISDVDVYSVTNGLETQTIKTPFDYSIIFGVRKIKRFGYEPREAFKRGLEASFSDGATEGLWKDEVEFLFQHEYKRQQGQEYFDLNHMVRYIADSWLVKVEYLKDGFADVESFESSQRYR